MPNKFVLKKKADEQKGKYVVYLDGAEWCTRNTKAEAEAVVNSYDGEKDCWYEFEKDASLKKKAEISDNISDATLISQGYIVVDKIRVQMNDLMNSFAKIGEIFNKLNIGYNPSRYMIESIEGLFSLDSGGNLREIKWYLDNAEKIKKER